MQGYNFTCDFVWVQNLVYDIKGGIQIERVSNRAMRIFELTTSKMTGGWK
jgi:hypothetical protein